MIDNIVSVLNADGDAIDSVKVSFTEYAAVYKCLIVNISGQIDTYNSSNFQRVINRAIDEGYRNFIFNCKSISYMSSTGIGSFTYILKALKDVKGHMVLCGIVKNVFEVFKLLGFSSFFEFYDDINSAKDYLSGSKKEVKIDPLEPQKVIFPIVAVCPCCRKKYKISKASAYRCNQCKNLFIVNEYGETFFKK